VPVTVASQLNQKWLSLVDKGRVSRGAVLFVGPAWARVKRAPADLTDAAFAVGAALGALDVVVRAEPMFAEVWRQLAAWSTGCSAATIEDAARALGIDLKGRAGQGTPGERS